MQNENSDHLGHPQSDDHHSSIPGDIQKSFDGNDVYGNNPELYQEHFKEQYLMYCEMADRVSARRHRSNVFFLSLQTAIFGIIAIKVEHLKDVDKILTYFLVSALILVCIAWWWIIRSYRNLNSAKYRVIGKMEASLPYSPYWKEEWKELGEGKNYKIYLPLTIIEAWLPIIFTIMYLSMAFFLNN